jgi:hypothetical protein
MTRGMRTAKNLKRPQKLGKQQVRQLEAWSVSSDSSYAAPYVSSGYTIIVFLIFPSNHLFLMVEKLKTLLL